MLPAAAIDAVLRATAAALSASPFAPTVTVQGAELTRAEARTLERTLQKMRRAARLEKAA